LWLSWLERAAVNRKVGGSSPPRGDMIFGGDCEVEFFSNALLCILACSSMLLLLSLFSHHSLSLVVVVVVAVVVAVVLSVPLVLHYSQPLDRWQTSVATTTVISRPRQSRPLALSIRFSSTMMLPMAPMTSWSLVRAKAWIASAMAMAMAMAMVTLALWTL
jgi:hypothetical protein